MPPCVRPAPFGVVTVTVAFLAACGSAPHDPHPAAEAAPPAPGIAVPDMVRRNLGVTWATAEYRVVQGVLRMPGRFEAEPGSRRRYHTPLAGRVDVLVRPYQQVAAGDPLYRIHAEDWQRLQLAIAEARADAASAAQALALGERHAAAVEASLRAWTDRRATLERVAADLGGMAQELAETATAIADLSVQAAEAERDLLRLRREAIGHDGTPSGGLAAVRLRQALGRAAAITGMAPATLLADQDGTPAWLALEAPVVRAAAAGVVEADVLGDGAWVEAHTVVLTVTDPAGVRLRATALQADLPRLADGLPARIVAADPALHTELAATLVLGPLAEAADRTAEIIARPQAGTALPAWIRPGVTANLEVAVSGSADEELAIPVAATIRDGLRTLIFRRDPRDPDRVLPIDADLGADDGRWVAVLSGLRDGDQVVLGGIYPLMLSQQGARAEAGHFHADGTFHTGKH